VGPFPTGNGPTHSGQPETDDRLDQAVPGEGCFRIHLLISSYEGVELIMEMDNFTFGVTMLVAGMGGTLVTLGLLSLMMTALGKLFPYKEEEGKEG
jgi:hypothetical protein